MKCYRCENTMECEKNNYIKKDGNKTIVIENTPTYICKECFEEFYDDETIEKIENVICKLERVPFKMLVIDYKEL